MADWCVWAGPPALFSHQVGVSYPRAFAQAAPPPQDTFLPSWGFSHHVTPFDWLQSTQSVLEFCSLSVSLEETIRGDPWQALRPSSQGVAPGRRSLNARCVTTEMDLLEQDHRIF